MKPLSGLLRIFQFPFHRDGPCDKPITSAIHSIMQIFQFPFHRDGPCDFRWREPRVFPTRLSVPFSSGWALRLMMEKAGSAVNVLFQFPFHRDGPCDRIVPTENPSSNTSFSSLFIGMGLAIVHIYAINSKGNLSVPFSSGWALRLPPGRRPHLRRSWLSVPFSSGWALRCHAGCARSGERVTFSSLFIGMGLAISSSIAT